MSDQENISTSPNWQSKIYHIIFESDTPNAKTFDVILFILILASVAVVMLDSVASISEKYGTFFLYAEWMFTILFCPSIFLNEMTIRTASYSRNTKNVILALN